MVSRELEISSSVSCKQAYGAGRFPVVEEYIFLEFSSEIAHEAPNSEIPGTCPGGFVSTVEACVFGVHLPTAKDQKARKKW